MEEVSPNVRKRARIAYICFLIWGIFLASLQAVEYVSAGRPLYAGQVWGMLVTFYIGPPAIIALIVGVGYALGVCREMRLIKFLLLATAAVVLPFVAFDALNRWPVSEIVINVIFGVYSLVVIGLSIRGLFCLVQSKE